MLRGFQPAKPSFFLFVQEDYSILADAQKAIENRHAVWSAYHSFCLGVAQWTTTPLIDGENQPTLSIEAIRQAVDDNTVKVFQLRKQNKVNPLQLHAKRYFILCLPPPLHICRASGCSDLISP